MNRSPASAELVDRAQVVASDGRAGFDLDRDDAPAAVLEDDVDLVAVVGSPVTHGRRHLGVGQQPCELHRHP